MALRDRWEIFDLASLALIGVLLLFALVSRRLEYSRNLAASAVFLLLVYLLLPRIVFGSAYADMRLVPYMIAVAVIGIRLKAGAGRRFAGVIAALGVAFMLVRLASTTFSFWLYDRTYDRMLTALDHIPREARLVSFVGRRCGDPWAMSRLEHLPAMAIVRRHAFSNDQWAMAGAQLLSVDYPPGQGFETDPSQIVTHRRCRGEGWRTIDRALAHFPRGGFDYVWLINPPPYPPALTAGLTPLWRSGTSVLYRVTDASPPIAGPEERK